MSFAENLKKYRKLRGISRKEIAQNLNMLESSYGLYEQGRTKPDTDKLKIIAEMLKVSTDELLDFRLDELQYCINQWNIAGYEIEIYNEHVDSLFIETLKEKDRLDESKEDTVYITIHNKDKIKSSNEKTISKMTMPQNQFINLTKELEEKSKTLATVHFKKSAEMLFLDRARSSNV